MTVPILASAVILLFGLGLTINLKNRKRRPAPYSSYVQALHLYMDKKLDEAIVQLKATVKQDTNNIMAYIHLGNIYREKGEGQRAAKIHRNLLVRGDLKESDVDTVLQQLMVDYQTTGEFNKAAHIAERLVQRKKNDIEVKRCLLSLYEKKGDWDKAFFYRQSINKWTKKKDHNILALYKVMAGNHLVKNAKEHEARIRYREATKIDKHCIPAYLYWGDSYKREDRLEDALKIWQDFVNKQPQDAHFAISRLQNVLYELGRFGEIEKIYQNIIKKKPKDPAIQIQLIEIYRKQGNLDLALTLCEDVIDKHPDCISCYYAKIVLLQQHGKTNDALQTAIHLLESEMHHSKEYTCGDCGHESKEPLWHCPVCHSWNTFVKES